MFAAAAGADPQTTPVIRAPRSTKPEPTPTTTGQDTRAEVLLAETREGPIPLSSVSVVPVALSSSLSSLFAAFLRA
jgi:hypothetical protein